MMGFNVPFVNGNIPYLNVTNITVGTQAVDLALGFRNIRPVGLMLVRIISAIPTGTTGTLPVTLTLNGNTGHDALPEMPLTICETIVNPRTTCGGLLKSTGNKKPKYGQFFQTLV